MKNKVIFGVLAVLFVAIIGGASVLYDSLKDQTERESLVSNGQEEQQEESKDQTQMSANEKEEEQEENQGADQEAAEEQSQQEDKVAALDFTVYDKEGNEVQLFDFKGKPVVLNFWASWCGPCQMEMPDFEAKYQELGEEVHFVMVNATSGRENKESADAFLAEKGYTFPVYYDLDGEAAYTYGAYSLPISYFIDAEGYVKARAVGMIDGEILEEAIEMISNP